MKNIKIICWIILMLTPQWIKAQEDAPIRIELESVKDQEDYHFATAGENGAFVFYEGSASSADSNRWVFLHYDTNLVKDYHFIINTPAPTEYVSHSRGDNHLYFLFQKRFPKKDPVQSFLVTVDLRTNLYLLQKLPDIKNREISQLYAIDNNLVLVANGNRRDSIYFYHCDKNDMLCLGDIFPYRMEFCAPDTFNHRWLIGLTQTQSEQVGEIFLYTYDYVSQKGDIQLFPTHAAVKGDHTYNSARAIAISPDTTLIIGTYNTLQDRYSSNLHSGVYTLMLHGDQFDSTRYYNYTSLKKGNDDVRQYSNLNLQLIIGGIFHNDEQISFTTEVIYPEYSYNYSNYDPYYGSPLNNPTTVFNGYRYINGYITTFNKTGELIWDYYFPFNGISSMTAVPLLRVGFFNGHALIYFTRNNRVTSTLLDKGEVVEKMASISIESSYNRDDVDYNRGTRVEHWYGNYYLVSGYQYILNRNRSGKGKRYVFFANKLQYK